jgi:release factor H-coupled RctB family protein
MEEAVGMPDLHPGKDSPIGAVFRSQGVIYPHLVGSDKGCGMALWKTALRDGKLKLDRWERKLEALAGPWDGDASAFMAEHGVSPTAFDASLGTVGRGNHFAELQRVFEVVDAEKFAQMELDAKSLYILVHSGSRGFGESILHAHTAKWLAVRFAGGSGVPRSARPCRPLGSHQSQADRAPVYPKATACSTCATTTSRRASSMDASVGCIVRALRPPMSVP